MSGDTLARTVQPLEDPVTRSNVRLGPGFVYMPTASALVACGLRSMANTALKRQIVDAERELGLDVQLAIVLVTYPIGCDDLFYVPVSNDVSGIGYAATNGIAVFDDDPETRLEGIAFLNDWPYWEAEADEFRTAFLHEVGHRWGARVRARRDGVDYVLTGREGGHWSYFLDSRGSPLEGNRFEPTAPFETATPALRLEYSPLDLYLMGVIEPQEVGPIRLLRNATADGRDCLGHSISAASPPQVCESKSLNGDWIELGIEDVITAEGPRSTATTPTRTVSVGVFVFGSQTESWSSDSCERMLSAIGARLDEFAAATGDRLQLENLVGVGLSCSELVETPALMAESKNAGCSVTGGKLTRDRQPGVHLLWMLGLLLRAGRRLRRITNWLDLLGGRHIGR